MKLGGSTSRVVTTSGAPPASDEASKKFGNAKAISSDMFFGRGAATDVSLACISVLLCISRSAYTAMQPETRSTLSRFEGASSISSSDFYGGGPGASASGGSTYDYGNLSSQIPDVQVCPN